MVWWRIITVTISIFCATEHHTICPMGASADPKPARQMENIKENDAPNISGNEIIDNLNYSKAIQSVPSPSNHKFGNAEVKARYDTHNGMPAIIFKSSDYYAVMAEEC